MKRKLIFIIPIGILVAISMVFSTTWVVHMFTNPRADHWYREPIKDFVSEYLRENEQIEGKISIVEYYITDFDSEIANDNVGKENKKYPFKECRVTAETRNHEFTLYLMVQEDESLKVVRYEKGSNYNPFL